MKRLMLIMVCMGLMAILTACSIPMENVPENGAEIVENTYIKDKYDSIYQVLSDNEFEMTPQVEAMLSEDFVQVEDVEFIQHSNGREVTVYQCMELPTFFVLYDGVWMEIIEAEANELAGCEEVYADLYAAGLNPTGVVAGISGRGAITLENSEFALMNFNWGSMFSVLYDDVDANSGDLPIKALIFCNGDTPVKVELVYTRLHGDEVLSENNIREITGILSVAGLGEEAADLAREMGDSLNKPGYERHTGAVTVRSTKSAARMEGVVFDTFSVGIQ